ncbi:hypothetical protein F5B22DRAFT_646706 [Xylaria bambusicola]|uniref:uncharacterized protein n=1 Tax=Xylaria bambusicola TaxID=326684 RepID=UPI0020089C23|nr:uncharacterized protein F5B22DRAFT_646706 [Xylaria bambusicola]KAI0515432.1 hypothetical protein F5B22DRAFT_646706 [Xylaria bambusicola]
MPIAPGVYWDLLDRYTPPVKRRATHAKARTGCLTCKRRKVKCDEAKPWCARCVKAGYKCAGYEDSHSHSGSGTARKRADTADDGVQLKNGRSRHSQRYAPATLRPKPCSTAGVVVPRYVVEAPRAVDLVRLSLTPTYLDVGDAMYFERFKFQMLADLGVWCGSEYWRHKILREILLDKTVQHAALASAAIVMDIEQRQQSAYAQISRRKSLPSSQAETEASPLMRSGPTEATATTTSLENTVDGGGQGEEEAATVLLPVVTLSNLTTHGKAALRHYTASISLNRQSLAVEGITSATARPSLTATFFYSVLELVQGNISEADRILTSGVTLLDSALSQRTPAGRPAVVEDDEIRDIQLAFDRMRVTWGLCPYFGGKYTADTKRASKDALLPAHHFQLPSPDASVRTKQMFWNAFSSEFGQFMVTMQDPRLPPETLPSILAQRTKYLVQLRYWLPILSDLCAADPGSALLCTTKVYAQTAIIFLNCFLDRTELAYDAYTPIFKDIVSTYERLLPSSSPSTTTPPSSSPSHKSPSHSSSPPPSHLRLTLDVDLFHIITFTVSKCRHKRTRAAALRVFAETTRRQALWTNSGMLAALRALSDLEDAGRVSRPDSTSSDSNPTITTSPAPTSENDNSTDNGNSDNSGDEDGFVPAEARYRYVSSEWDFHGRQMVAVFEPVVTAQSVVIRVPIHF